MSKRFIVSLVALMVVACSSIGLAQTWNAPGMDRAEFKAQPLGGPPPSRDLTGLWDASGAGIGGSGAAAAREAARAPFTPLGEQLMAANQPGNGPFSVSVADINDPLSTIGDPSGFPRLLTFELRPVRIVHTPNQVLMLYMFEKRWRVIWTDGRDFPDVLPDNRWYGYSVGEWEDDSTFVVNTIGLIGNERVWLDQTGRPMSDQMTVEERFHLVDSHLMELTVTVTDPAFYTEPWVPMDRFPMKRQAPDYDIIEMLCAPSDMEAYATDLGDPASRIGIN